MFLASPTPLRIERDFVFFSAYINYTLPVMRRSATTTEAISKQNRIASLRSQ